MFFSELSERHPKIHVRIAILTGRKIAKDISIHKKIFEGTKRNFHLKTQNPPEFFNKVCVRFVVGRKFAPARKKARKQNTEIF